MELWWRYKMTEWIVKITGVSDEVTRLTVDFDILGDGVSVKKKSVNMEGDTIDWSLVKTNVLKEMKRLDGMEKKKSQITSLIDREFIANEDFTSLTPK